MEESIFERLTEQMVSTYANWFAIIALALGLLGGIIVGLVRKQVLRDAVLGLLWGLIGPLACLSWHIVDARTSYYDKLYIDKNPGRERFFWRIIEPYPLDSVYGLATMAIGFIVAGIVLGLLLAVVLRVLDRKLPPATQPSALPETRPAEEASSSAAPEASGGDPQLPADDQSPAHAEE